MTIGNSPNQWHMFRLEIECIQAISPAVIWHVAMFFEV